jgi:hypothetical protein
MSHSHQQPALTPSLILLSTGDFVQHGSKSKGNNTNTTVKGGVKLRNYLLGKPFRKYS